MFSETAGCPELRFFTAFEGQGELLHYRLRNICYCRIAHSDSLQTYFGEQNNTCPNLSCYLHMVATLPVQKFSICKKFKKRKA